MSDLLRLDYRPWPPRWLYWSTLPEKPPRSTYTASRGLAKRLAAFQGFEGLEEA